MLMDASSTLSGGEPDYVVHISPGLSALLAQAVSPGYDNAPSHVPSVGLVEPLELGMLLFGSLFLFHQVSYIFRRISD